MFLGKSHNQTILEISQGDITRITADSFLIDRQARELSRHTLKFYKDFLRTFIEYCNANSLTFIQEIMTDFLRRYFLAFGEKYIKCTLWKLTPLPHQIKISFEPPVHVDGIDWDMCSIFQNVIQDDFGWDEHVPLFQLFGKLVDRLDGDLDDQV